MGVCDGNRWLVGLGQHGWCGGRAEERDRAHRITGDASHGIPRVLAARGHPELSRPRPVEPGKGGAVVGWGHATAAQVPFLRRRNRAPHICRVAIIRRGRRTRRYTIALDANQAGCLAAGRVGGVTWTVVKGSEEPLDAQTDKFTDAVLILHAYLLNNTV